ncbi:MAG: hypothetical protein K5890_02030 [Bacteroidales bacterium]|nr:hypothetical protein [Bacteroidales bacterium]
MQKSFEQLIEILEQLELVCKGGLSLPAIEKDIALEKMRNIYELLQMNQAPKTTDNAPVKGQNYEVYQGIEEDVDLFFDTDHESYSAIHDPSEREVALKMGQEEQKRLAEEQRRKEEEQKRLAEEQRRKEEEQKRLAEEQRRKEEQQKHLAEEQRRKEEEQKRLAEEQRRKEEEQKRLAEEQRRKEEEQKRNQPSDEDDLLQFMPKEPSPSRFQATPKRSLNDLFQQQGEDHSLGAQFQNAKVSDLTKAISINDKFTYIKELFNNKGEEFSAAITSLNQCRNMEEAFNTLETLKQKYYWDSTSTTYLSLCDLLRRKFN